MDRVEFERFREAFVVSKVGVWKDSLRRRRWWMRLYLLRKTWVLCEGWGSSDGFDVSLRWKLVRVISV